MEPAKLLMGLFDKKRIGLIKLFLDHPEHEYGLREAAKASRLPPATAHRILRQLEDLNIVAVRKVKKLRLHKLAQSKESRFLDELLAVKKTAIEDFMERARGIHGVEQIILHGKAGKERASILLIGGSIDNMELSRLVAEIQDRYRFKIIHTTLERLQYEQMLAMGLFPQEKEVLYSQN